MIDAHKAIKLLMLQDQNSSVRANLEKEVQDLENQVRVWKQKAQEALEGVAIKQEYEDLIKAVDQERASVQRQLGRALKETEEQAAAVASGSQALKDELDSAVAVIGLGSENKFSKISTTRDHLSLHSSSFNESNKSEIHLILSETLRTELSASLLEFIARIDFHHHTPSWTEEVQL